MRLIWSFQHVVIYVQRVADSLLVVNMLYNAINAIAGFIVCAEREYRCPRAVQ